MKKIAERDPKKERVINALAQEFQAHGFQVRRERLKMGHGWKVVSGSCRAGADRIVFIDRRLSQDEQVAFLWSAVKDHKLPIREELVNELRS